MKAIEQDAIDYARAMDNKKNWLYAWVAMWENMRGDWYEETTI